LAVKAATILSYCAGHALPALLLGFFSWAVAELLTGFAAYAEAMYSPPIPEALVPIETQSTGTERGSKPSVGLIAMQVNGSAESSNQARSSARTAVLLWRGWDWHVSIWSSIRRAAERRQAIAELQTLDDRALRDIGIYRCDIEHIVRHGARRE
jgi:uncharacterized protein YjiS (DUF1127 family)